MVITKLMMAFLISALAASPAIDGSGQNAAARSSFRGRLTDMHGNVIPGVALIVKPGPGGPLVRATSRADGSYEIAGLSAGRFDVYAALAGFDVERVVEANVGARPFELDFRMRLSDRLEYVYVPEPPFGTIEGDVKDAMGFPMPFAVVHVRQLSGTRIHRGRYLDEFGYADAEGHYSVNAPAGRHQVSATYPGYRMQPRAISLSVGNKSVLDLTVSPAGRREASMESLRAFTNCGRLGFANPAPSPLRPT